MIDKVEDAISDATLDKVKHFTVGFARAGEDPAAKGSGILVRYKGLAGILTCGHVDEFLRKQKQPVGLVRLNRGTATEQFGILDMGDVFTHVAGQPPWDRGSDDIAFIQLSPDLVGNIEKDVAFLNLERNFEKAGPTEQGLILVHAVFGLVQAFTEAATRQGRMATNRMRGVLTPGHLNQIDATNAVLECFKENLPDLPNSFGGTSGGGLWRIYLRKQDDMTLEVVHHRLIGIACREEPVVPPRILCQGPARLQELLDTVHREMNPATE